MPLCLEIGPAKNRRTFEKSTTMDCTSRVGVDIVATWGEKLDIPDNTYDYIYASHVLEHVPWNKVDFALEEAYRILRSSGRLEVWVPDFQKIVEVYLSGKFPPENWIPFNDERSLMKWVAGRLFYGVGDEASSCHRSCFDANYLVERFERAGFSKARSLAYPPATQPVNHMFINLGVIGYKQ